MYDSKTFKMSTTRTVGAEYPWVTVFGPPINLYVGYILILLMGL